MPDRQDYDLRWLLSPTDTKLFLSSSWTKQPLYLKRNRGDYYADLFSEEALDRVMYSACRAFGAVEELTSEEDRPRRVRNYAAAQELVRQGKSLRIPGVQRFSRELLWLSNTLEKELSSPINVNLYFSPGGSQALKKHYDTHDVFVLQVYGQKRWKLFDSEVKFPMEYFAPVRCERERGFRPRQEVTGASKAEEAKLTEDFIISCGDLLYLPRGFWHVASAEPSQWSCHLTVGAATLTYLDLLTVALAQASLRDVRLRRPLPFNFSTSPEAVTSVKDHLAPVVEELSQVVDVPSALGELSEIFVKSRAPIDPGFLQAAKAHTTTGAIPLDSRMTLLPGTSCLFRTTEQEVSLVFNSKMVSLPECFTEACRMIAGNGDFRVGELPGEITDEERISLVQRLMTDGLLVRAPEPSAYPNPAAEPKALQGYLPVRVGFESGEPQIEWLYFDHQRLSEPMFFQTVNRLTRAAPATSRKLTGAEALKDLQGSVPPSGFIFHISRCGSTLLSNAMKTVDGAIVISEPQPLSAVLNPDPPSRQLKHEERWEQTRHDLLKGLVSAFGQRRFGDENGLIVKFSSWHILCLSIVRRFWPSVPRLIVIRNPVEVMVSCLDNPPGWMKLRETPQAAARIFDWSEEEIAGMTPERFCARGIGRFLEAAINQLSGATKVLDYGEVNADSIEKVIRFFSLDSPNSNRTSIHDCLAVHSKDSRRAFTGDTETKRQRASKLIRQEAELWAQQPYNTLRSHRW